MQSRERLRKALNHEPTDRPPIDLGSTAVTGAHVNIVHALRVALGLPVDREHAVRITEPYQCLGGIEEDLRRALQIDCVGVGMGRTILGWENKNWKPWVNFQGTPCMVPEAFNTETDADGRLLQWPDGDRTAEPCAVMPSGGHFFDTIIRQPPIDDATLRVEDNLEEFTVASDEELARLSATVDELYRNTSYGLVGNFSGTGFGDIALVPAPFLKAPKGIRDISEWYMSTRTRRDHIYEIFDRQSEIALRNLELIFEAIGNRIEAVFLSGTDFGMQSGPFISVEAYDDLYAPFHRRLNDWVHKHTTWKTFIHSCGSVMELIPHFIDSGFDILNPVQCSAACMDPAELKQRFGAQVTFWGGAADAQTVLAFGTPEEVYAQARERIRILGAGGGFVFNPVHNIQSNVSPENALALFRAIHELPAQHAPLA